MASHRQRLLLVCGISALVALTTSVAWAQTTAQPSKATAPEQPRPPQRARQTTEPSKEQIDKRIERVKKRAATRKAKRQQRRRDSRRALRKRLARLLHGQPVTPEVKRELSIHGRRTAQLRRIRFIAATKNNYDVVVRADKALARENSRHDGWWRQRRKQPVLKKNAAEAK